MSGRVVAVVTEGLLDELAAVLIRPKFRRWTTVARRARRCGRDRHRHRRRRPARRRDRPAGNHATQPDRRAHSIGRSCELGGPVAQAPSRDCSPRGLPPSTTGGARVGGLLLADRSRRRFVIEAEAHARRGSCAVHGALRSGSGVHVQRADHAPIRVLASGRIGDTERSNGVSGSGLHVLGADHSPIPERPSHHLPPPPAAGRAHVAATPATSPSPPSSGNSTPNGTDGTPTDHGARPKW